MKQPKTTILVVDDDEDIRFDLREVLEEAGHAVVTARHGQDALEVLQYIEPPSLILLDLMMPLMDGLEFLEHQRRDPKIADIPVIVVTAFMDKAAQLQTHGLIPKPVELETLMSATEPYRRCAPRSP